MATVVQPRPVQRSLDKPELVDQMRQFEDDSRFLALHHDALLDRFPEEWVAVFGGAVVAHDTNINGVLRQLSRRKIPRNRVAVAFLTRQPKTLIL